MRAHNQSTYSNHGCRCDVCKADHAAYQRTYRAKRAALRFRVVTNDGRIRLVNPYAPHGTLDGYANFACRCEDCTRAKRERNA